MARIGSYDPTVDRVAIFGIFYAAFSNGFCSFLVPTAVSAAERQTYTYCVARAVMHLGPQPATLALLEADRELNGEILWYRVGRGHLHWLALERDGADLAYARARTCATTDQIEPFHADCGTMVRLDRVTAVSLESSEHSLTGLLSTRGWSFEFPEPATDARPPVLAFVVGCDPEYFGFYPKFLLSVMEAALADNTGRSVVVHCHVSDMPEMVLAFFKRAMIEVSRRVPRITVSFSYGPAAFADGAYFTCLRFLSINQVTARHHCGVFVADIDSLLDPGFFKYLDNILSYDVGMRMYNFTRDTEKQAGGEPGSIGAHPLYLANTPIGRRFAEFLPKYLEAAYDTSVATRWTIDQCAIAQAYDLILRNATNCPILNFAHYDTLYHLPHEFGARQACWRWAAV